MKGTDGLQKVLYLLIVILGVYILYKGGSILLGSPAVQRSLDSGKLQRFFEDQAVRTWAPGYAGTVETQESEGLASIWTKQVAPIYSYLASGQAQSDVEEPETEKESETKTETESEPETEKESEPETETVLPASGRTVISEGLLTQLEDFDYLLGHYYTVDPGTVADEGLLDADKLLQEDMTLQKTEGVPQILIYHTHSQEAFFDSREGEVEDTIVGMGAVLAEELQKTYGYGVIHDTNVYDLVDGVLDRSAAYDYARDSVEQILQENPTIEVVIDLHRDGVEGQKFVTEIDGRPTSMVMFFNGISRNSEDEPLTYLQNPYIVQNLAFSLQMQLAAETLYPGFTRNIYLKAERFNLHLRPRSLLIEAGTQLNTVEEEKNAMLPLARLLDQVLGGA